MWTISATSSGKNDENNDNLNVVNLMLIVPSSVRYQVSSSQAINYSDEAFRLANIIDSYSIE